MGGKSLTTRRYASAESWLAVDRTNRIVGAFETLEAASEQFGADKALDFVRAPEYLKRAHFVWGVVRPGNVLDKTFGGDIEKATRRALEVGGELKLFKRQ